MYKIAELREKSDEEIIQLHDALWERDVSGDFYLNELRRREAKRAEDAAYTLARRTFWFTMATAILALGSLFVAAVAICVSIHLAH